MLARGTSRSWSACQSGVHLSAPFVPPSGSPRPFAFARSAVPLGSADLPERFQHSALFGATDAQQPLVLDLAHALARDTETRPDLLERARVIAVQAEVHHVDFGLAPAKHAHR